MNHFNVLVCSRMTNYFSFKRSYATTSYVLHYMHGNTYPGCRHLLLNESTKCESSYFSVRPYSRWFISKIFSAVSNIVEGISGPGRMKSLGTILYITTDMIDFQRFYEFFEMEDTFQSWFSVVLLHVWILAVRVMHEKHGSICRDSLISALWHDVQCRLIKMDLNSSTFKKQLKLLNNSLLISFMTYDNGLLGSDANLANALWVIFFHKKCNDPRKLEVLIRYIRCQMVYLDSHNIKHYKSIDEIGPVWMSLVSHIKDVMEIE